MCDQDWPQNWHRVDKHRKAGVRAWQISEAGSRSAERRGAAQYNPEIYRTDEQIKEVELKVIQEGELISGTCNRRTYYLKLDNVVGYCCGTKTQYLFVEWNRSGGMIHGHPICEVDLEDEKQVSL
jgi:hypothetical protein